MTLGCIKCTIDCIAIMIVVGSKNKILDLGYSVIVFKKYYYMIEYINQYYPDYTTKANNMNNIDLYIYNNPDYYKVDQKHFLNNELLVY